MRNLVESLIVLLFVFIGFKNLSAQEADYRFGIGIHTPLLDNGAGLTVDYDLSWSPNKYTSFGLGATLGAQSVSDSFISGDKDSYLFSSLNAVGRLHLPFKNVKFRPTFTLTTGPAFIIEGEGSDRFNFENSSSELDIRTSLALGHEGMKSGVSLYTAVMPGDIGLFELGLRYYKRF